ncbi:hypothetical protein B0H63DRAFT_72486 [Podospora didyma]|uniref:Tryptophan--tRNA ligase, mitochondrial n=1 Tax=Podospora didyma TaxID=330526 RepID=A0AAE0K216_9PEZI|nr:hypothetical protein B0H63DRAFT_72486 [Podospora didyma]
MKCSCRSSRNAWQLLKTTTTTRTHRSLPTLPKARPFSAQTDGGSNENERKVIFSGIQPTGVPHLGNYLGAMQQWKRMQDEADANTKLIFSVVDLHAITVPREHGLLGPWKREMLAALLAIGLDPDRCVLFYQSTVPAHSELQWILSCTASTGYLSRMTQWKSKLSVSEDADFMDNKVKKSLKHGLFSYPILQAADILVHQATHVPVGDDQRQHLEFARECVVNFNTAYKGQHLVAPQSVFSPAKRVMSLQNPAQKMSKSDPNARSRILITDSVPEITKKIMSTKTDMTPTVSYDPATRPGVSNLLEILSHFDPRDRGAAELAVSSDLAGAPLAELKKRVVDAVAGELVPIGQRFEEFMSRPGYLDKVVRQGGERARESAEATMRIVRAAVELGP